MCLQNENFYRVVLPYCILFARAKLTLAGVFPTLGFPWEAETEKTTYIQEAHWGSDLRK